MEIFLDQLIDEGGGGNPHPSIPLQHIFKHSNVALYAQNLVAFGCKKKYISLKQTNEQICFLPGGSYSGPPYWHGFNLASRYATLRGIIIWKNRFVKIWKSNTAVQHSTVVITKHHSLSDDYLFGRQGSYWFYNRVNCNRSLWATSLQPIASKQSADWLQSLFIQFPPQIHVICVFQGSHPRVSQLCKETLTLQTCWMFQQKVGLSMR